MQNTVERIQKPSLLSRLSCSVFIVTLTLSLDEDELLLAVVVVGGGGVVESVVVFQATDVCTSIAIAAPSLTRARHSL